MRASKNVAVRTGATKRYSQPWVRGKKAEVCGPVRITLRAPGPPRWGPMRN